MDQADELTQYIAVLADLFEVAQHSSGAAINLNKQECRLINVVGQFPSLIMREIADRAKLSVTNTTGIVDKLVKKDYLYRQRSEDDRRIIKIYLTPQGEEVYAMEQENYRRVSLAILKALDSQEQQAILSMMRKVSVHLHRQNSI